MKALILVAHGSRRKSSNEEVVEMCQSISDNLSAQFDYIGTGFLELAEPSIPDSIIKAIESGATEVIVIPYFLSAGRHVIEDIPEEVEKARGHHPEVEITVLPHIGASGNMHTLIESMVP